MAQNLYRTLGVTKSASASEIKKAYRKLAKQYHPDATGDDPAAGDKFKEVSSAFDVLGDAEKRKLYDEFGEDSLRSGFDAKQARAYKQWTSQAGRSQSWGGSPFGAQGGQGFGGGGGFDDILSSLFGNRSGPMQRSRNMSRTLEVDLETAMRGGTMRLSLDNEVVCTHCGGTGAMGRSAKTPCMACHGRGRTVRRDSMSVKIPARTPDGSTLKVKGKGELGARGHNGDLILTIKITPHKIFQRDGKDLRVLLPITVSEAVLGAKVPLVTPDGRTLTVTIPKGSQSGKSLRLKGQGLGTGKKAGNLIVELSIRVPKKGGEEAAEQLDEAYKNEVKGAPRG